MTDNTATSRPASASSSCRGCGRASCPPCARRAGSSTTTAIGGVVSVHADFGFVSSDDAAARAYVRALGGGSLLDIGIYPLSFCSLAAARGRRRCARGRRRVARARAGGRARARRRPPARPQVKAVSAHAERRRRLLRRRAQGERAAPSRAGVAPGRAGATSSDSRTDPLRATPRAPSLSLSRVPRPSLHRPRRRRARARARRLLSPLPLFSLSLSFSRALSLSPALARKVPGEKALLSGVNWPAGPRRAAGRRRARAWRVTSSFRGETPERSSSSARPAACILGPAHAWSRLGSPRPTRTGVCLTTTTTTRLLLILILQLIILPIIIIQP